MSDLTTVAIIRDTFYRLVGSQPDDPALTNQSETTNLVAYLALTRGTRRAQRWMLKNGFDGWRKRSSALSFSGTDAEDGGRYAAVPADFLRAYGTQRPSRSALVEPNGDRWGSEIEADQDHRKGNYYYFRSQESGQEIWLARTAVVPATLHLDYHYRHPVWTDAVTIDFPLEARPLIPAEAALVAMNENWLPGGVDLKRSIMDARSLAQDEARMVSRPTKQPRSFKRPVRYGNRW